MHQGPSRSNPFSFPSLTSHHNLACSILQASLYWPVGLGMSFSPNSLNGKIIFIFQNPVQISPPSLMNSWLLLCVTDTVRASTLASYLGKDVGKAVLPWVWGQTYMHRSRKPMVESLHTGHWGVDDWVTSPTMTGEGRFGVPCGIGLLHLSPV